nr:MAG TPA: tail tube protein [Caudoviricetes sp.]
METTKLDTVDYEFEGRTYRLTCNMNAIAYVQDEYDGNLVQALDRIHGIKSTLAFLAGMLADAADSQGIKDENGLPLVFTRKQLGRKLTLQQTVEAGKLIYPLVRAEVMRQEDAGETPQEDEKN